jgi:hypothetical protein
MTALFLGMVQALKSGGVNLVLWEQYILIFFFLFSDIEGCIPYNLTSFIKCPTAQCETCQRDIFLSAFPVVFKRYLGYILGMCCSLKCVKKCYQAIDLPLVYPTIEDMSLALALVQ